MTIRPIDLRDIPKIARYRNDVLTLDNARALTRGHPLGTVGLLAYVNPARHLYAAIKNSNNSDLLGGIIHTRGESFAKLLYLAPHSNLHDPELPALIEHLTAQAGEWEALHVLAEIDEASDVFPALRTSGFSVYAWQRVWDVSQLEKTESSSNLRWSRMQPVDLHAVQSLHYQIVPQLLHPIEPASSRIIGFVCRDAKCYASVASGVYGIVLTPLIHPEVSDVGDKIVSLVTGLPDRRGRAVYLNVRSYQAWLEPVLEDLGAQASSRHAVMVKHLAHLVKNGQTARSVPANAGVQPTQMSRIKTDE